MFRLIRDWIAIRNTPEAELIEIISLLAKGARRCAYDLRHAASEINHDQEKCRFFYDRANFWASTFEMGGMKDYRHGLHAEIERLESESHELRKLCEENEITHSHIGRPF